MPTDRSVIRDYVARAAVADALSALRPDREPVPAPRGPLWRPVSQRPVWWLLLVAASVLGGVASSFAFAAVTGQL